jgi:hypothetical protein
MTGSPLEGPAGAGFWLACGSTGENAPYFTRDGTKSQMCSSMSLLTEMYYVIIQYLGYSIEK